MQIVRSDVDIKATAVLHHSSPVDWPKSRRAEVETTDHSGADKPADMDNRLMGHKNSCLELLSLKRVEYSFYY